VGGHKVEVGEILGGDLDVQGVPTCQVRDSTDGDAEVEDD
jgi:hypothetical protein